MRDAAPVGFGGNQKAVIPVLLDKWLSPIRCEAHIHISWHKYMRAT